MELLLGKEGAKENFLRMSEKEQKKIIDFLQRKKQGEEIQSLFFIAFWEPRYELGDDVRKYAKEAIKNIWHIGDEGFDFLTGAFWYLGYKNIAEAHELRDILLKAKNIKISLESAFHHSGMYESNPSFLIYLYQKGSINIGSMTLKKLKKWASGASDINDDCYDIKAYHILWFIILDLYIDKINPMEKIYWIGRAPSALVGRVDELRAKRNAKNFIEYYC